MKKRTRKVLSLLLAASMVFTMNTVAFAEEAPVEEATVEAEASDAEIAEAPVEDEVAAPEAAVDDVDDTAYNYVDDKTGLTIHVDSDKVKSPVSKITYAYADDKAKVADVVTMTDVTNPLSWNNFYGAGLLKTAIFGTNQDDAYLNNSKEIPVSENGLAKEETPEGYKTDYADHAYAVLPVNEADNVYLLVAWGFIGGTMEYVDGAATPVEVNAWGKKDSYTTPLKNYDGRKIRLYKTGKATATAVEDLEVKATLVKYEGAETGTVTEYTNVTLDGIKVSKDAENASVTLETKNNEYTYNHVKDADKDKYGYVDDDLKTLVAVHELTGSGLPSFQITKVTAKDKTFKNYKKDLKTAIKDVNFLFGVKQKGIVVTDVTDGTFAKEYAEANEDFPITADKFVHIGVHEVDNTKFNADDRFFIDKINTASSDEIKDSKDDAGKEVKGIESILAKSYMEGNGFTAGVDRDDWDVSILNVSKFDQDKAKATITFKVPINNGKGKGGEATRTLAKDDYTLTEGTLAGQKVTYLDFPENGNFTYAKYAPNLTQVGDTDQGDPDDTFYTTLNEGDLSAFGYKWAFRQTPTTDKKKAKTFRRGIYVEPSIGFVYEQ